jgi:hypothetical protein
MNEFKHLRDWRRVAGETELEDWSEALNDLCLAYESDNPFAAPQRYVPSPYTIHCAGSRLDFGDAELLAVYAAGGQSALRECAQARGLNHTLICEHCGTRHEKDNASPYMRERALFWNEVRDWIEAGSAWRLRLDPYEKKTAAIGAVAQMAEAMREASANASANLRLPSRCARLFTDSACWTCGQPGAGWEQIEMFYPTLLNFDTADRFEAMRSCNYGRYGSEIDFDILGLVKACRNCHCLADSFVQRAQEAREYAAAAGFSTTCAVLRRAVFARKETYGEHSSVV